MVGGKVLRIYKEADETTTVLVRDKRDLCHVRVRAHAAIFRVGDSIWWQGRVAFWTPTDQSVVEHELERVGYSYSDPYRGTGIDVTENHEPTEYEGT